MNEQATSAVAPVDRHKVDRYLALSMRQLALQEASHAQEDALIDELDGLWSSMEPFQRIEVEHVVSSAVARLKAATLVEAAPI